MCFEPAKEDKEFFIEAPVLIRYLRSKNWDVSKAAACAARELVHWTRPVAVQAEAAVCATAQWRQEPPPKPFNLFASSV